MKKLTDKEVIKFRELLNNTNVNVYALTNKNNVLLGNIVMYSNGRTKNYVSFTLFTDASLICVQGKSPDTGAGMDMNLTYAFENAVVHMINILNSSDTKNIKWSDAEAIEIIRNIDISEMYDEHRGVFLFRDIGLKIRYMMNCLNP